MASPKPTDCDTPFGPELPPDLTPSQREPPSAEDLALLEEDDASAARSPQSDRGSSLLSEPVDMELGGFDPATPPPLSDLRISPILRETPVPDDQPMAVDSPHDVASTPTSGQLGAAAPALELDEANASKPEFTRADARQLETYTNSQVPKTFAEAAQAAIAPAAAPSASWQSAPPVQPQGSRLTLQTHHVLPDTTPEGHTHALIGQHPWAEYVTPPRRPIPTDPDFVTSVIPLTYYPHIGGGGYMSNKFVRSLFPRRFRERPSREHRLPIYELMRLHHAIDFRAISQRVIDDLLNGRYQAEENSLPETPAHTMPSLLLPSRQAPSKKAPSFPVLYQVVSRGPGQGVTLEAKDFFVPGPDRRELHLIKLDQFATNILTNTRGFDCSLVSVKDFVWVYTVEPTQAALRDPQDTLDKARVPKATVLDNRVPFFFRVKEFVFVTPPPIDRRTLGIILSVVTRFNSVKGLRIAFESAPEAVAVSPSACTFPLDQVRQDEIVSAISRLNVSTAMRFSAEPASKAAREFLCDQARRFSPAHPDEGLLPLKVFKLTPTEKNWLEDRAGPFSAYSVNPDQALRRMAQLFNVACSALVAVNCINDDRRTHSLSATVPSMDAFPAHFDITLDDMSSECGWTHHRPVYLWIVGSRSLIRATIRKSVHSFDNRSLAVRLVAPPWQHQSAINAIRRFGTMTNDTMTVPVSVKLGLLPAGADPVYELISSLQLFQDLGRTRNTPLGNALDTIYGTLRPVVRPVGHLQELITISISGRNYQLRPDQVTALRMGEMNLPVLALQAAFGTGKTVMGALIACRIHTSTGATIVAATTTNTAVAQFTDTLLRLDDFKNLNILRYVSDSALAEGTPRTSVDMQTILKGLVDNYAQMLPEGILDLCRRYKNGRQLLETYLFDPSRALHLSDEDRDEYRLAERDVSDTTKDVIAVMFKVRKPAIVCLTTSALLNALSPGGIFHGLLDDVKVVIGDEASQIPEPAMVAVATRLTQARHIYIGDVHQLEPHVRCPRNSNPARFGAQGVMDLLLNKGVPTAHLTTTFRAHPELNALPNQLFYDQQLIDGTAPEERQMFLSAVRCPNSKTPFVFVDVPGTSQRSPSGSHSNTAEADVCRRIITALLAKKIAPTSLAIITFYKEQYRLLQPFAREHRVDIYTVDSVQGREKDIVVLLSTKTGPSAERGEFLDDPRRLNVALTRCRHGQFVLGHESTLTRLHFWQQVVQWARHRRARTTAAALPSLLA